MPQSRFNYRFNRNRLTAEIVVATLPVLVPLLGAMMLWVALK